MRGSLGTRQSAAPTRTTLREGFQSMASRLRSDALVIAVLGFGLAACSDGFGPSSTCQVRLGIEVCAGRDEYRPGATVDFTVTNRGSQPVLIDACSYQVSGRSREALPFVWDYDPTRGCGPEATIEDVVAMMRSLDPGASLRGAVGIAPSAFQGFYRVGVWQVDASGALVDDDPFTSNDFDVLPSAG